MKKYRVLWVLPLLFLALGNSFIKNDTVPVLETITLNSTILNEKRVVNIWTPDEYKTTLDSLPVLYMLDGGVEEDFPHLANTISDLVQQKKIKPIILVGIENTQRRRDLTGPTKVKKDKTIAPVVGESEKFRNFIQQELFPEISKKYRCKKEKGILGESLAGLFVTETFLLHPEMFDFYITFDPSLWWNDKFLLKNAAISLAKFSNSKKQFWFASSGTKGIIKPSIKLSKILKENNNSNIVWDFCLEPKEKHNTIFKARKEKALIWSLKFLD